MKLTTTIDVTLKAGQNNCEMPRVRAIRAEKERLATWGALCDALPRQGGRLDALAAEPLMGARVTCHRPYEMQPLDNDNLSGSFKFPRDEVARFLGVDDSTDRIHWIYTQTKAERTGVKQSKPGWRKVKDKETGVVTKVRKVVKNVAAYDTRPTITIEVMPVADIDPQVKRIRELEAQVSSLTRLSADRQKEVDWLKHQLKEARCLLGMVTT
jgi:hypothetical protein